MLFHIRYSEGKSERWKKKKEGKMGGKKEGKKEGRNEKERIHLILW